MPKQAKSVQICHKVPKYVANVWQWRTPAGCLAMIYTVYKGVGLGMGNVVRDFHDAPQTVTNNFACYRSFAINRTRFEYPWKWIKTVRRVIADLIGQIDQRAQWVETVFLMCDLKQIYTKLCTSSISVSKAANPPGCVLNRQISMTPRILYT